MPTAADFGINLSSPSYTSVAQNRFVGVSNPPERPTGSYLWCTEFAFGRAIEKGLINQNTGIGSKISGHAGTWDDQAGSWSKTPRANSFIVWDGYTGGSLREGHVAFVERINADGSLVISEANWDQAKGSFNSRTIPTNSANYSSAKFIYLDGGSSSGGGSNPGGSNVLTGGAGNDRLSGLATNDTLIGNAGNDTLYGEAGNDILFGGPGNDYLDGYASFRSGESDILQGDGGIDTFVLGNATQGTFYLGNGQATINDYNFRDDYIQLSGNSSQYRLTRQGNDTLVQTSGGDTIAVVKNVTDLSFNVTPTRQDFKFVGDPGVNNPGGGSNPGGSGGKVLTGGAGNDRLDGLATNDTLTGNGGNDTLYGEAGNDILFGGPGNDYLDGYASFRNAESDILQGDGGIDTFVLGNKTQGIFYLGNGQATINDYNFRDDYIQLSGSPSQYRLTRQGNDTLVQTSGGDTIAVVKNVTDLSFNVTPARRDFTFV